MKDTTIAIIKPDAVRKNLTAEIILLIQKSGLKILRERRLKLTSAQVAVLYQEHIKRPYYKKLKKFMQSGDSVILLLSGENATIRWRRLLERIRTKYAADKTENCVHGSDSLQAAAEETALFFPN